MEEFILLYYALVNIAGLWLMKSDKKKAVNRKRRIRERTLWLFALLGGAVGSTAGMYLFRHKTKHLQFKIGFPLLAAAQLFLLTLI